MTMGNLQCIRDLEQHPHLQHMALVMEMSRFAATTAQVLPPHLWPRSYQTERGEETEQELVWGKLALVFMVQGWREGRETKGKGERHREGILKLLGECS